jgi:hypothetical protein
MKEKISSKNEFSKVAESHIEAFNFVMDEGIFESLKYFPKQHVKIGETKFNCKLNISLSKSFSLDFLH